MFLSHLGTIAETIVCDYLKTQGYTIIRRNWRKPWGEIDIIAERDGGLVFIEVKAGKSELYMPELHANDKKMRKVLRTAQTYLLSKKCPPEQEWRIDIVSVIMNDNGEVKDIRQYENIEF